MTPNVRCDGNVWPRKKTKVKYQCQNHIAHNNSGLYGCSNVPQQTDGSLPFRFVLSYLSESLYENDYMLKNTTERNEKENAGSVEVHRKKRTTFTKEQNLNNERKCWQR